MRFSRSVEAGSKLVILIYKKICLKPRHQNVVRFYYAQKIVLRYMSLFDYGDIDVIIISGIL